MKRTRGNSVTYLKTVKRARRGTAANPIVISGRSLTTAAMARKLQEEKKGVDVNIGDTSILATTNTNGDIAVLNLIQQGAGSWNRIGRKAHLKSIRLKGVARCTIGLDGSNHLYGSCFRRILVWDKQPSSGSIPTFDTIFGYTDQSGTEASTVMSPPRYDNMDRFQVLLDKTICMNPGSYNAAAGGDQFYVHEFDDFVNLKGRESVFSGQSTPMTIADISTGALYLIYRATDNTAGSKTWEVMDVSIARLRYTD